MNFRAIGKTFQAIAVADFYRDDWPLLIVTTGTARASWEQHIKDLLPSVPADSIQCLFTSNDHIGNCKILITSYALMDRMAERLTEKRFGAVILVNRKLHWYCIYQLKLKIKMFIILGRISYNQEFQNKNCNQRQTYL